MEYIMNSSEAEGYNCGRCGVQCPPNHWKYHQKLFFANVICFYVLSTDESGRRVKTLQALKTKKSKYGFCYYCLKCFKKYAPIGAKKEAKYICDWFGMIYPDEEGLFGVNPTPDMD